MIERKEMATAMALGPGDATLTQITSLPDQMRGLGIGPGAITCPVEVQFSNGYRDIGYFSLWVQQDGQMMVGWGQTPLPFGAHPN
ncbi:MAG: hypothetical protein KGI51_10390 [Rhodospirillales bacterium]|nr:hypothetical protein [Rhodospirillales bacterium]